jgi:hypothetical protein
MLNLMDVIALMCFGAVLIQIGGLIGAWLVYKSKSAAPGEPLFGKVPKGEVFTI